MPARIWTYIVAHRWLWPPLLLAGAVVSSVLHNVFSAVFRIEEPVLFLLTLLLAVAALIALIWVLLARAAEL